jgi:hypothetical protein
MAGGLILYLLKERCRLKFPAINDPDHLENSASARVIDIAERPQKDRFLVVKPFDLVILHPKG